MVKWNLLCKFNILVKWETGIENSEISGVN